MKKLSALILALVLLVSVIPAAYAANATPNTTTLTTTVPSASYVLNIPADQEIPFGQTRTDIGNVTITDSKNFAYRKNVEVTVVYAPFSAEEMEISTTIPYTLLQKCGTDGSTQGLSSGEKMTFEGKSDGTVKELTGFWTNKGTINSSSHDTGTLCVAISSENWGRALAGNYRSTITFTSEVVVE